jgi:deazaflavin-dependent oxidoreductase (nitroreductase family)
MNLASPAQIFFRALNRLVTPLVQAGFGSPAAVGAGAVVVETNGRKSGQPREVPLLALHDGRHLYVSTVRPSSQWVQNLQANPSLRVWLCGTPRHGQATIYRTPMATFARLELAATPIPG